MKTIIKIFLIIYLTTSFMVTEAKELEVKTRVYWHVFEENKNKPIKNVSVYIKKNWKILWNWKSNKEWLYDIIIEDRSDYLNLCVESNSFTEIKNINYCVTISAFQEIKRIIDDVEVKEVEYDFYTNKRWENLNQRYEEEIVNKKTEQDFSEYQEILMEEKEKEEKRIAEEQKKAELDKLKSDYKMVNNTEMTWPLEAIQIIGTVKSSSWSTEIDYNRVYVIAMDHFGNKLKEEKLSRLHDFNMVVKPKWGWVFLHPVNLKIESREYKKIEWEIVSRYENEYRLITKEKNIVNIKLKKKEFSEMDKTIYEKEKFPIFTFIFIIMLLSIFIVVVIKNRIKNKREDY